MPVTTNQEAIHRFCLDIAVDGRTEPLTLQALSEEDRKQWMTAMDNAHNVSSSSVFEKFEKDVNILRNQQRNENRARRELRASMLSPFLLSNTMFCGAIESSRSRSNSCHHIVKKTP